MIGCRRLLLGGAAMSLALSIGLGAPPALAQDDPCAEFEGEALAACRAVQEAAEPEPAAEPEEPEAAPAAQPEPVPQPEIDEAEEAAPEPVEPEPMAPEPAEADGETVEPEPFDAEEAAPEPVVPEAADPEELDVEAVEPEPVEPEPVEPEAVEPEAEAPEAIEPEAIEPEAAEPEALEPETVEPEAVEPEDAEPAEVEAEPEAPEAAAPEAAPEAVEPEASAPEVVTPETAPEVPAPAAVEADDTLPEDELEAAQDASREAAVQQAIAAEETKSDDQRARERADRARILGAAAAGLAAGAILPQVGALLVGQVGDRVILQQDDRLIARHDETPRLSLGGDAVVDEFADGVTRITVTRPDGSRGISWRNAAGEIVRRVTVLPDGREITLFDGTEEPEIRVSELPPIPRAERSRAFLSGASEAELTRALAAQPVTALDRTFSLRQILAHDRIRWLMPSLDLDAVTFETGSATLGTDQIMALDSMGRAMRSLIGADPQEVFLVEGHTDAVGPDHFNLALSDRRAETVGTLLTAYYGVPPENIVVQGFGEQDLKIPTLGPSRENRRVEIRRITPLLR